MPLNKETEQTPVATMTIQLRFKLELQYPFPTMITNTPQTSYIGYLIIHRTHVTANNSINNNVVFFLVSDLKIVYYNDY